MTTRTRLLAGLGLALLLSPFLGSEAPAGEPSVVTIVEGREDISAHRVLTLFGKGFAAVKDVTLQIDDLSFVGGTTVVLKSKALIVLDLPAGLQSGPYVLRLRYGKSAATLDFPITVGGTDTWQKTGNDAVLAQGKAGIGTPTPTANLHVSGVDGVLFDGTINSGAIPVEGFGTRMMWYPAKAAFRAGGVGADHWDDGSVGTYSTAMGWSTRASGTRSTALGYTTNASGTAATALGYFSSATGDIATAMGDGTTAQAYASLAIGRFNVIAGSTTSVVSTDPVLVVGNGINDAFRSNAFTLLKNGNLTIAGTLTQNSDARVKTDVAPVTGVLAKIAALHAVSYRFKDGTRAPAARQIGLLAQEVREAFPELVAEDPEGKLSVAYGNFSAVLLEAVQEQQATIEAQRKELESMKERLARLETRLGK